MVMTFDTWCDEVVNVGLELTKNHPCKTNWSFDKKYLSEGEYDNKTTCKKVSERMFFMTMN